VPAVRELARGTADRGCGISLAGRRESRIDTPAVIVSLAPGRTRPRRGYAQVRAFSAAGRRIPITVQHQTQVTPSRSIRVEQVTLPSHGAAQFVITLANRNHGDCSPQHGGRLAVLLPSGNDSAEPVASWRMDACDRAAIAVTPYFAAAYIPPVPG
jgi:hypothetical protein